MYLYRPLPVFEKGRIIVSILDTEYNRCTGKEQAEDQMEKGRMLFQQPALQIGI